MARVNTILASDGTLHTVPWDVKGFAALSRAEQTALLAAMDENLAADERAARAKRWTFCPIRYANQHRAFHQFLQHYTANA